MSAEWEKWLRGVGERTTSAGGITALAVVVGVAIMWSGSQIASAIKELKEKPK